MGINEAPAASSTACHGRTLRQFFIPSPAGPAKAGTAAFGAQASVLRHFERWILRDGRRACRRHSSYGRIGSHVSALNYRTCGWPFRRGDGSIEASLKLFPGKIVGMRVASPMHQPPAIAIRTPPQVVPHAPAHIVDKTVPDGFSFQSSTTRTGGFHLNNSTATVLRPWAFGAGALTSRTFSQTRFLSRRRTGTSPATRPKHR